MEWLRWYHGSVNDPKFRFIAKRSGQNVAAVIAVWASLLERASKAECRGDISGFDYEIHDMDLGLDEGACAAIVAAMQGKGLIHGDLITNWDKRQPPHRNGPKSEAERKRDQRERERKKKEGIPGGGKDPVTGSHEGVTTCHEDVTKNVTGHECHACHDRREEKREEEKREETYTPGCAKNEDCAGDSNAVPGVSGEERTAVLALDGEPSLEFQQIREHYSRMLRDEGPTAGLREFYALASSVRYRGKGMNWILDMIDRYATAHKEAGTPEQFIPGLGKFINDGLWEEFKRPMPRASPAPALTFQEMNEARVFAELAAMDQSRNGEVEQYGS